MASLRSPGSRGTGTPLSPFSPASPRVDVARLSGNLNSRLNDNSYEELPLLDIDKTVFEAVKLHGVEASLNAIRNLSLTTTVYVGLWSNKVIKEGIRLPTDAVFIDEYVAKSYTTRHLLSVRDKYIKKLRGGLCKWLNLLESDKGWKYHGTKNGTILHRREIKGSVPMIKGSHNMGNGITLKEFNDISMDRDYYHNLHKQDKSLKHFRPCATWAGSSDNPWIFTISWLCYNGLPPIVSDRDVLTASLTLYLDTRTTVTICTTIKSNCIKFQERPKHAVPIVCRGIYMVREDEAKSIQYSGVMQASMKLLVPQFMYIRSHLFTQPVDFGIVKNYAYSKEGRSAIGRNPVSSGLVVPLDKGLIIYKHLWVNEGGKEEDSDDIGGMLSEDDGDDGASDTYSNSDGYMNWDNDRYNKLHNYTA